MTANRARPISIRKKFAYAMPALALAVVGIPVYVYVPKFYTDVVGINITVLGYLLFSVRIFDAITDPALGFLSDKTKTPLGRRRPYIALGSILIAAALYLLFNPPAGSPAFETVWFGVCIYALFLFWTAVVVPYESLGPEITYDYHERTSLFGWRDGFLIAGTLMAASSPALIQWVMNLPQGDEGERLKFFWLSAVYGPLVVGSCWLCALAIKEKGHRSSEAKLWGGLRDTLRNRPFMILLASYTISAIGNNLPATLILFYVQYVLKSDLADLFLVLYFVTGILFLPGWIWLSRRTGKKRAWLASMVINTGAFIGVFFLGPGDAAIYGILVVLSGIGFGATLAIPSAIQADVIDYDELLTGERREGQYIGLWSISKKLAAALGVGVGLAALGMAGYTPNVEQTEQVRMTLRVLYALVPSICNIVAFLIAMAYPIDSQVHQNIRNAITDRQRGKPVLNPLNPAQTLA
ncbi:MAG: MFS transporter [Deltaproteobacteria bacterium]|jgi:GPH family glycoside/pentoside/hexuronide:cation symporter|nr:MFS transporter [Deltaproteobacteria bacterium]